MPSIFTTDYIDGVTEIKVYQLAFWKTPAFHSVEFMWQHFAESKFWHLGNTEC